MLQRLLLCCSVWKNVLMGNIIQARDCVQATATVLVTKECHSFCLSTLQLF
jgi:hypothetical protein